MIDPTLELKIRARLLHKAVLRGDPDASSRVRTLPELRAGGVLDPAAVQRKHCLAVVAREHGFSGWPHAARVLAGDPEETDFGTLLYPTENAPYPNLWFSSYEEAHAQRQAHGGYLLPYRRQFVVADRPFIEALGLDPDDPDWDVIGRDWARPRDPDGRMRLYGRLIAQHTRP